VAVYQVEPYVIAADVYGVEPHVGKGGWTWYTGSAGWMYRIAVESILGMRVIAGDSIAMKPCVPNAWEGFRISYRLPGEETLYEIDVGNPQRDARGVVRAEIDGKTMPVDRGVVTIPLLRDGGIHRVTITLGGASETGP
jgi:cyclic beta-1,2-glucan synthetase